MDIPEPTLAVSLVEARVEDERRKSAADKLPSLLTREGTFPSGWSTVQQNQLKIKGLITLNTESRLKCLKLFLSSSKPFASSFFTLQV